MRDEDLTVVKGIPCTNWARTVIDLATERPRREVELALDRCETLGMFDLRVMEASLAAVGKRRGSVMVRSILDNYAIGEDVTASPLEEVFRTLCVQRHLPLPRVNVDMMVGERWIQADFFWPDAGLIVEVDGYATHGTRKGFRSDRRRDRNVGLHTNLKVLRYAWEDVKFEAATVADEVVGMLEKLLADGDTSPRAG